MPHRRKLPSLTDYDPARERTAVDQKRLDTLFPRKDEDGRPLPMEDRMGRVEAVAFDVVNAQIEAAPKIAAAAEYIADETNARTSAMAYAASMHSLLADVKRTQRVRESRSKLMYWAIGAPVFVVVIGLWTHADVAALATAAAAVGGVAVAVVNAMAQRSGVVREGDSIHPPKSGDG